ncbi:cytochrome c551 [Lysinibacillus sp. BW-2-10]|uniref:cytochrome c551 n=1 Tax=Lysinibacillus sp. BW-2-10 TaxID=2590030 RepID=UPI00117BE945|nr:cytochrome c [Lysinibacillus sp. BW-2-10]TSI07009.1 cytochrome c [Lysinibacillus sp. BW-2-10]
MKKAWLALVFGSALFLAACGGGDEEGTNDTDTGTEVAEETTDETTDTNTGTDTETGTDEGASEGTDDAALAEGEALVKKSCVSCHGGDLQGMGNTPSLADVGSRYDEAKIHDIILNGQGGMPPGLLKGEDAEAAAAWLATQK